MKHPVYRERIQNAKFVKMNFPESIKNWPSFGSPPASSPSSTAAWSVPSPISRCQSPSSNLESIQRFKNNVKNKWKLSFFTFINFIKLHLPDVNFLNILFLNFLNWISIFDISRQRGRRCNGDDLQKKKIVKCQKIQICTKIKWQELNPGATFTLNRKTVHEII